MITLLFLYYYKSCVEHFVETRFFEASQALKTMLILSNAATEDLILELIGGSTNPMSQGMMQDVVNIVCL